MPTPQERARKARTKKIGQKVDFSKTGTYSEKMGVYESAKKKLELAIAEEKKQKFPDAARISKMEQKLLDVNAGLRNLIANGR